MKKKYDRKRIRWSNTWIKKNCKNHCQECLKTFTKYLMNSTKLKTNWTMPQIEYCNQKTQRKDKGKKNITMSLWPENHWWWNQSESSLSTLWNHPKWEENESWKCLRLGIAKEAPKNAKGKKNIKHVIMTKEWNQWRLSEIISMIAKKTRIKVH